jgi:hypothetical protein
MGNLNNFNADQHDTMGDYSPIPNGEYVAIIKASESKKTKNGDGAYIQFTFSIVEGQYKNRTLITRLNLFNKNETAVRIAQSELATICKAIKKTTVQDSTELHNIPMRIKVVVKPGDAGYSDSNEIKNYYSLDKAVSQTAPVQTTTQAPQSNGRKPWEQSSDNTDDIPF